MWIILAVCSAVSAGFVSITIKAGIKNVDTNLSTFLRTGVVLIFTFIMVIIVGSLNTIGSLTFKNWAFIIASGVCTGLSWISYFKALQLGSINKVVAIDKLSTVLTMILAITFLGEAFWWVTFVAMALMISGTMLMINKNKEENKENLKTDDKNFVKVNNEYVQVKTNNKTYYYLIFAVLSLIFASATSLLAKIGMQSVDSNLGTFLRTLVVLVMAFIIVAAQKNLGKLKTLSKKNWLFIIISGALTGISWLCYYAALQTGIVSVVVPIDKLSILVVALFSFIIFKEKLNKKALVGLFLLTAGTLLLLI